MGNQAQLDKSPLCDCSVQERIGTYSGTYRNGNEMATFGQEWESQAQLDKPFGSCRAVSHFIDFVEESHGMYRNVYGTCTNFLQVMRISRGLCGTYKNV